MQPLPLPTVSAMGMAVKICYHTRDIGIREFCIEPFHGLVILGSMKGIGLDRRQGLFDQAHIKSPMFVIPLLKYCMLCFNQSSLKMWIYTALRLLWFLLFQLSLLLPTYSPSLFAFLFLRRIDYLLLFFRRLARRWARGGHFLAFPCKPLVLLLIKYLIEYLALYIFLSY